MKEQAPEPRALKERAQPLEPAYDPGVHHGACHDEETQPVPNAAGVGPDSVSYIERLSSQERGPDSVSYIKRLSSQDRGPDSVSYI